jgi:hypothetical protein
MKKLLVSMLGSLLVAACGGGGSTAEGAAAADNVSLDAADAAGQGRARALAEPGEVWSFIANEYESFQVTGTQTVRYGQGTKWVQRSVTGSGQCTNEFFGSDPAFLVVKRCEVLSSVPPPPPAEVWTFIANEYESFQVTGTQTVRYGQGTKWVQRSVTGSGQCTNEFFGSDPAFLVVKRCEVLSSAPPPPPTEVWTFIANEYESFQVTGTQTVRYGQGTKWIQRSVTGSGQCTNEFFGSDPAFLVVKRCEVLGTTAPPPVNTANDGSPLGTNLAGLTYFSTQVPFIDQFKSSAPWVSGNTTVWDDGRSLDLDSNGWVRSLQPGQIARTLMLVRKGVYPSGKYVVLYEGDGTLEYVLGWRKLAAESSPGRDVVEATSPDGNFALFITRTNPSNHVRNIRVLLPGGVCGSDAFVNAAAPSDCPAGNFRSFEQVHSTLYFNPLFLERSRKYKVLRYMDWMETNFDIQNGTWADRPQLTDARWNGQGGVPLEVMIELANRLNAYPWFNIPHRANDDYVRSFAQMVRERLSPALKTYIEYSNETWNPGVPASAYAEQQAQALGIAVPGDLYTSRIRYHSRRAPQIFDIWSSVFGGNARLVRVLGGQAESPYLNEVVTSFENAHLKADALGVNAYFYLNDLKTDADAARFIALTNAQAFQEIRTKALAELAANVKTAIPIAAKYNLKLVAFESGNSLWPPFALRNNTQLNAKLDSIQRDPEMKSIYTQFLNDWFNAGGQLLMHFADISGYSGSGGWFGALEHVAQPREQAPKFDVLMTFIENNRNRITP